MLLSHKVSSWLTLWELGKVSLWRLDSIKAHKAALIDRTQMDSEIAALWAQLTKLAMSIVGQVHQAVTRRKEELHSTVLEHMQMDSKIAALQAQLTELAVSVAGQVQQAVTRCKEELRSAVLKREEIVEPGFQQQEEEVMEAVHV